MLLCLQAERLGQWEQYFRTQASFLPYLISTKHLIIQGCFMQGSPQKKKSSGRYLENLNLARASSMIKYLLLHARAR